MSAPDQKPRGRHPVNSLWFKTTGWATSGLAQFDYNRHFDDWVLYDKALVQSLTEHHGNFHLHRF